MAEKEVTPNNKFDFTKLNSLAIVSLATAVSGFGAVAGVITGHVALAQIKKTGQAGRPAALAGIIVGYVVLGAWIALAILGGLARARGYEFGGQIPMDDHHMGGMMGDRNFDDGGHFQMGGGMMIDPNQPLPAPTATPEAPATN
jgi:hypothetical protein